MKGLMDYLDIEHCEHCGAYFNKKTIFFHEGKVICVSCQTMFYGTIGMNDHLYLLILSELVRRVFEKFDERISAIEKLVTESGA